MYGNDQPDSNLNFPSSVRCNPGVRGTLVDEAALRQALESGKLSAAGIDCFVSETGGNPAFAAYENIFMLPHIGGTTRAMRDAIRFRALDNLDAFFAGKTPGDLVN